MITPERLKELIEQGATIYCLQDDAAVAGLISLNYNDTKYYVNDYGLKIVRPNNEEVWELHELFETRSEAEWHVEFGNVERVERLSFPSYDRFLKLNCGITFYVKGEEYKLRKARLSADDDNPNWILQLYKLQYCDEWSDNCNDIFEKPLTEEYYTEACQLCVKLFKGEEI